MFRISNFKAGTYKQCPQKYKCMYVDKIPSRPKPYLTMGAHVHNALHDFYSKLPPTERTEERLIKLLKVRWLEDRKVFASREEENKWGTKAVQMLRLYVYHHDVQKTPVMLEDYYDIDLGHDYKLLGRIDRVDQEDDGLHVIDYKTGKKRAGEIDETQLALYAAIVSANVPTPVVRASFLFLEDSSLHTIDVSDYDYTTLLSEQVALAKHIEAEKEFLPKMNKYCMHCDYLQMCPKQQEIMAAYEKEYDNE